MLSEKILCLADKRFLLNFLGIGMQAVSTYCSRATDEKFGLLPHTQNSKSSHNFQNFFHNHNHLQLHRQLQETKSVAYTIPTLDRPVLDRTSFRHDSYFGIDLDPYFIPLSFLSFVLFRYCLSDFCSGSLFVLWFPELCTSIHLFLIWLFFSAPFCYIARCLCL